MVEDTVVEGSMVSTPAVSRELPLEELMRRMAGLSALCSTGVLGYGVSQKLVVLLLLRPTRGERDEGVGRSGGREIYALKKDSERVKQA